MSLDEWRKRTEAQFRKPLPPTPVFPGTVDQKLDQVLKRLDKLQQDLKDHITADVALGVCALMECISVTLD
jgi:hypothetical protein